MADTIVQEKSPAQPEQEGNGHVEAAPKLQASRSEAATAMDLPMEPFGFLIAAIMLSTGALFFQALSLGGEPDDLRDLRNWLLLIAAEITWLVFHYQVWSMIPRQHAETTPAKAVGLLFIPVVNLWWVFRSCVGLQRSLNAYARSLDFPGCASTTLASVFSVLYVVNSAFLLLNGRAFDLTERPIAGTLVFFLLTVPAFICWLLLVLNQRNTAMMLLTRNPALGRKRRWDDSPAVMLTCGNCTKEFPFSAAHPEGPCPHCLTAQDTHHLYALALAGWTPPSVAACGELPTRSAKPDPWWWSIITGSLTLIYFVAVIAATCLTLGAVYVYLGRQFYVSTMPGVFIVGWLLDQYRKAKKHGWKVSRVVLMVLGVIIVPLATAVFTDYTNTISERFLGVSRQNVPFRFHTPQNPHRSRPQSPSP